MNEEAQVFKRILLSRRTRSSTVLEYATFCVKETNKNIPLFLLVYA